MSALVCPHQPACPGCPRLAEPGPPADLLVRLRAFAAAAASPAAVVREGPATEFRRRARLAIRGRADAPKLGIFEAGTHRAVHIPNCLVHHPHVNVAAAAVRSALARSRLPTYSDDAHAGLVRYLQVVVERETDRVQLVLVTNSRDPAGLEPVFGELRRVLGERLHSLWWNGHSERTNVILGPHWQKIEGEDAVRDRSGNASIFYPPQAFGQSNLDLATRLAEEVRSFSRPGERVLEFYAGVGAISLGLAESAGELHLNEVGAGSLAGLALGIAALPEPQRARVSVHAGSAAQHAALCEKADLVIVDPPRKGLDAPLLGALIQTPPARLAYVACGFDSFIRDATALLASGHFSLTQIAAYDLFPHTEHLEVLALFEKSPAR